MLCLSILYRLVRSLLGLIAVLVRGDLSKDAELLVLRHENAVLRRQISPVRYRPADRVWLAALSRLVPHRRWAEVFAVTPGSPDRRGDHEAGHWHGHRESSWGHRRVQGELVRLGHRIAACTVWQILHDAGIDPAPRRSGPTWRQFLTAQAKAVVAVDVVHVDTIFLTRLSALIAVEHGCRRAPLLGLTAPDRHGDHPSRPQPARRPRHHRDVPASRPRLSLHQGIRRGLHRRWHPDPHQPTPNTRANALCERMIATLRRELLDRVLTVNEHHLRRILTTYLHHFNTARPHRTLGQLAPAQAETQPPPVINLADHPVRRRPILDGLTSEYQITA